MWNVVVYIMAGTGLLILTCLGYFVYLTINLSNEIFIHRQGNTCPQANGSLRGNGYNDIFFIEPNTQEAARIRAQLEKDDKDLPSYDEVMRIANLSSPTAAPAANNCIPPMPSALTMGASSSGVNTSDTVLSVRPYREPDTVVRPLTPPPYTPEPIGDTVVVPITTTLRTPQNIQST